MNRYLGQTNLGLIGPLGQKKISAAKVAIIGCGALGTVAADLLTRAGVGRLSIIDRDVVELSNLQRQTLFIESDAAAKVPKAEAAAVRLRQTNSEVNIEALVVEFTGMNALELLRGHDLVIDATDNYPARFTINEACLALALPWVYGGVLGTMGTMGVFAPGGPCFRCLFTELPALGAAESCRLTGVLGSVTTIVAAAQVAEAIKIITGNEHRHNLLEFDLASGDFRTIDIARDPLCPACQLHQGEFLGRLPAPEAVVVCGEQSVLVPGGTGPVDLQSLGQRLSARGLKIEVSRYTLRIAAVDQCEVIIFGDGRALIYGTESIIRAKNIYTSLLG
ncbi:MAG: ThiF family adenylyltransferase [Peptococcaceae bacterium]|nr:ThiF family adenylyltransferase [Peptococcaceae bacterium]